MMFVSVPYSGDLFAVDYEVEMKHTSVLQRYQCRENEEIREKILPFVFQFC